MRKHIILIILIVIMQTVTFSACKDSDITYLQPSSSLENSNKQEESAPTSSAVDEVESGADDTSDTTKESVTVSKSESKESNDKTDKKTETKKDSNTTSKTENTNSSGKDNTSTPSNSGGSSPSENEENNSSTEDSSENKKLTYEEYLNLTAKERQEYAGTFDSYKSFVAWEKAAKAEYEAKDDSIKVDGNGSLDLNDYLN